MTGTAGAGAYRANLHQQAPRTHRNRRTVWTIPTTAYSGRHYAVMAPALARTCILAGCPERVCSVCGAPWVADRPTCDHDAPHEPGLVVDPFGGSGTTAQVAEQLGRRWFLIDLDPRNEALMSKRTAQRGLL